MQSWIEFTDYPVTLEDLAYLLFGLSNPIYYLKLKQTLIQVLSEKEFNNVIDIFDSLQSQLLANAPSHKKFLEDSKVPIIKPSEFLGSDDEDY